MGSPRISVVTVCYNAVNCIEETISSVINQTYYDMEYIVIDGGSTDGTIEIIKKYRDCIAYFVTEPDNGIYDAMNKGLQMATGKWVNFMNAGDSFYSDDVLFNVANKILDSTDVAFGDVLINYNNVGYIDKAVPFYEHLPLHHNMGFNHQATFVLRKRACEKPFDTRYKMAADYNMIISLYRDNANFQYLDLIIAKYTTGGVSDKNRKQHIYETLIVDNPNRKLINLICAQIIYIKKKLYLRIKAMIFKYNPNIGIYLMEKLKHRVQLGK